jgi:hypothetical protein
MEMHQVSYFLVADENGNREAISLWVRLAIIGPLSVAIIFCEVVAISMQACCGQFLR